MQTEVASCRKCGGEKNYVIKSGKRAGKYHTYCRRCLSKQVVDWARRNPERSLERQRAYWKANPDKQLRARLRRYGVDEVWYKRKFEEQEGLCEICGRPESKTHRKFLNGSIYNLAVDHHHGSGQNRGLLCNECNTRLAVLESHDWLSNATRYLNKYHP